MSDNIARGDSPLPPDRRMTLIMAAVIILCVLPGLLFPFAVAGVSESSTLKTLLWLYPAYSLLSGFLAWQLYRFRRTVMCWIILVLLVLCHTGLYLLTWL